MCAYVPVPVPALSWGDLLLQFPGLPVRPEPGGLLSPRMSQGQDWSRVLAKACWAAGSLFSKLPSRIRIPNDGGGDDLIQTASNSMP